MAQKRSGEVNSDNQRFPPLREANDAVQRMYDNKSHAQDMELVHSPIGP